MVRKKHNKKTDDEMKSYETEITYTCPKRGKVTEKVKIKRYKTAERSYLKEAIPASSIDNIDEDIKVLEDIE